MHRAGRRRAKGRSQIFTLEEYILKLIVSLEGTFDLGAEVKSSAWGGVWISDIETLPLLGLSQEAGRGALLGLATWGLGATEAPWRNRGAGRWGKPE